MTEYTDVPRVNALHDESQQVSRALANLQAGGTLYSMVVAPPSVIPEAAGPEMPPPPPMMMAVTVTVTPPTDQALLTEMTNWLNKRLVEIADELTALGVTVPPLGTAAWNMPPQPLTAPPQFPSTPPLEAAPPTNTLPEPATIPPTPPTHVERPV